ncbi:F-box domain protein [Teladorsagia circumcincta]|uniref:F-box domain protein n=1 Tax=Teladorsagia circumcincta TaxID=45464 RepID=A0A2G9TV46_TELCI|nr:F-box domain protein [Teladorsagia circumcincta]
MAGVFSLPNELLMLLLGHLDGPSVRSFGNTCKRFRKFVLTNKLKLPKPELRWDVAQLTFGRRISLVRQRSFIQQRKRKRFADTTGLDGWEFTEEEFSTKFASLFFVITPREIYIKCKDFDSHIEALIRKCVGSLRGSTLALEMDKCSVCNGFSFLLPDFFSELFLYSWMSVHWVSSLNITHHSIFTWLVISTGA